MGGKGGGSLGVGTPAGVVVPDGNVSGKGGGIAGVWDGDVGERE